MFIIVSPNWRKFQHTAARRRLGCCIKLWKMLAVFQHTAARRRLDDQALRVYFYETFQHTAARRRLAQSVASYSSGNSFNTQPPEGGWPNRLHRTHRETVSTHSRPKAAGWQLRAWLLRWDSFNTQPPEGGWVCNPKTSTSSSRFQHTAARRRLGASIAS